MKNAHQEAKSNAFAFPGFYVRIVLENVDFNVLSKHPNTKPLVNIKYVCFVKKKKKFRFCLQTSTMKEKFPWSISKLKNGWSPKI